MAAISTLKVRTVLMLTLSLKMITGLPQQQTIHLLLARRPLSLVTGDFRYSHYHHFRARYFSMGSSESATEVITTLEEGPHMAETEIKKSRFIGYAKNVDNWEDAKSYISQVKEEHPKARHWCYGFQCGTNPVHERSSDDGEPSGTAGAPILGEWRGIYIVDRQWAIHVL